MRWSPLACAVAGVTAYLLAAPDGADLVAQQHRADLAGHGAWLWSPQWFAGHLLPSYSVLSPWLGAAIGVRAVGALAVIGAAVAFDALVRHTRPSVGALPGVWFSLAATAGLWTGRMTYLLGVAIGLAALLALAKARTRTAGALAIATALASPVAALFLALTVAASGMRWWPRAGGGDARRVLTSAALAACALAPVVVITLLFGEGGTFPFVATSFVPALAGAIVVGLVVGRAQPEVRIGAVLYVVLLVAAFAVPTAVGANATRLGSLFAGPVLAVTLLHRGDRRARITLAVLAVPMLWWAIAPSINEIRQAQGATTASGSDRALRAEFHVPLIAAVHARTPTGDRSTARIEVVPTANKGEAQFIAPEIPVARGWERQLDRAQGAIFYRKTLAMATYRRWLDQRAVRWIARPLGTTLDPASTPEARLVDGEVPWLRAVWRSADWALYEVQDPAPFATSDGRDVRARIGPGGVTLTDPPTGVTRVALRHNRWWRVIRGSGCVTRGNDGFLRFDATGPGPVTLRVALHGPRCR